MTDKLDAIPGSTGRKILEGLKDAVAGNFAAVTIEGQRWVRADAPEPLDGRQNARVKLWYRNFRGDVSCRSIVPERLWFGSTDWHPEPQWMLTAFDTDKHASRDFAMKDFCPMPSTATSEQAAGMKTIYVKPLRTLVGVEDRFADRIRDLLNATSTPSDAMTDERPDADEPYDPSPLCPLDACRREGCTRLAHMCLSKAPPLATPPQDGDAERERIARIVAARAFEMHEICPTNYTTTAVERAFELADEVLAATRPSPAPAAVEALKGSLKLVIRHTFNVGLVSGMKEHTSSKGGDTWIECWPDFERRLDAALSAPRQDGKTP
jgi:hypothetical protein